MPLDLSNPSELKPFLSRHGLNPNKKFGQHFLCSASVVQAIVSSANGCNGVLEIGPGPGVLTGPLSAAMRTVALEVDARMIDALAESAPSAEVRLIDALATDLTTVLGDLPEPRAVVSNLPYYITGALLNRIAEAKEAWVIAVLMMQKEVAQRILAPAKNSDRGSLSVFLQAQFTIKKVCDVPAGAFLPPPKVQSTVLSLTPNGVTLKPSFEPILRAGFSSPRKTLSNNLSTGLRFSKEEATRLIVELGFDEFVRPHMLTVQEWFAVEEALLGKGILKGS